MDYINRFVDTQTQLQIYFVVLLVSTFYVIVKCIRRRRTVEGSNQTYNTDCPICFSGFTLPIKSKCGHVYCLDCLYAYWKKSSWNNLCPLCRQPISDLTLTNANESYSSKREHDISRKLRKISPKSNIFCFKIIGSLSLSMSTFYSCLFCVIFLFLWTYAVSNFNKMINVIFDTYDTLYDAKTQINKQ